MGWGDEMSDAPVHTRLRDESSGMAASDWQAAVAIARRIDEPWFACQALAAVARYAPDDRVCEFADDAIREAERDEDPYRTVGASAWPLRALLEREKGARLEQLLSRMLLLAPRIQASPSRSDALYLVLAAVFPGGRVLWEPVHQEIMKAAQSAWHWRTKRVLIESIQMIAIDDEAHAYACLSQLSDGRHKRKLQRALDAGERIQPRGFFYHA